MLWEVEIEGKLRDPERARITAEFELLTHDSAAAILTRTTRGFLLEGDLDQVAAQRLVDDLLVDSLVETCRLSSLPCPVSDCPRGLTVLLKPGVMDSVAQRVVAAARDLAIELDGVRSFRRYYLADGLAPQARKILGKVLANDAIEQLVEGPLSLDHLTIGQVYTFRRIAIPLRDASDDGAAQNQPRRPTGPWPGGNAGDPGPLSGEGP